MNSFIGLIILIGGFIAIRLLAEKLLTNTSQKSRLFILVYVGILLLSLPVSYVISANQDGEDPSHTFSRAEEAAEALYQAIHDGNLPAAEHVRELRHWQFPYEESTLTITSSGQSEGIWVFVGRQQQSGQDIQITYYTTPYVFEQIDYTHLLSTPDVYLTNSGLFIQPNFSSHHLNFKGLSKEFYIAHFTGGRSDNGRIHFRGNGFFYVEAPPKLKIEATDGISLIFIDD